MANIKITDLATIADPISTDVLPIVDVSDDVTNKISIEELLKNVAAGTAAAPGIAFDGDPDTGVYNSGTNALAFSTGGTGRLFIDSSGNLGVGTSTPNYLLDVEKADAGARINALTGNSSVYLTCADNAGISTLFLGDAASPTTGQIKYRNSGDSLAFEVNGSERARIDSSGRLGVGTSSPAQLLHLKGSHPRAWLEPSADTETAYYAFGNTSGSQRGYVAYDFNTENMFFRTNGSERVRIDGQGRLGVGTSSPTVGIDLNTGDTNAAIRIRGTNDNPLNMDVTDSGPNYVGVRRAGTRIAYYGFGGSGNNFEIVNEASGGAITLATSSTERFRIDSSGNVGVGLTPTAKLHVAGTIQSSVGSHTAQMYSDGGASFFTSVGAYPSVFYTNGSERLRIDASGNVGLGTSGPSNLLHLNGTSDQLRISDGVNGFDIRAGGSLIIKDDGTERLRIGPAGQFGLSGANYGTSGQVLTSNGSASAPTWQTPSGGGGGLYDDYAIFQHTTSSGTDGGATSTGTWNTRPINTTAVSQTWASVSSNQITLSAGTYSIEWQETIYRSDGTQSRFRNVTDSTTAALGLAYRSDGVGGGFGKTTIASSKAFELQHYTASNDTNGLGIDAGSGENNVFATIKITKHA